MIDVIPADTAVTSPEDDTDAMPALEEDHVTLPPLMTPPVELQYLGGELYGLPKPGECLVRGGYSNRCRSRSRIGACCRVNPAAGGEQKYG